ncbi:ATP-binding protein [Izhakiella australiensis]|uniref:ATP-binding protein n=1 Tax=Izhakiella australiensis TaxID=1926881 RepID=A0A1S8YQ84_9GAMM|nr:ABC transporter ATP-binding protein [Izhakiella australiensis]OON40946.1 ATP-binding protein [Izhakiella australiensis]
MIQFNQVSKYYHGNAAVSDLTLHIGRGDFTVLIGTSGSGKSTTLKMINRLVEHDEGSITFADEEIRALDIKALRRRMGYAIQSIGLFPHWSVEKNIATVPELLGWSKAQIASRVSELLALLGLDDSFRQRRPHQLSGGQQQRVGVARALAADPEVLLMDEPFGALDPVTRTALQQEMLRIHQLSGRTIVLVTHDIDEALFLADKIVLMDGGKVMQQGTPLEMLTQPASDFVRDFFGRNELGVRLLSLGQAGNMARRGEWLEGETIPATMTLREALSQFISRQQEKLPVVDEQGKPLGVLWFSDLLRQRRASNATTG